MENTIHPEIEKLRSLAMRAYSGISFSPEKRGERILNDYSKELTADIETVKKHEGDVERYTKKYVSLLSDWLGAQSRCMSTMITGPANFPVARNEKANNSERNKYEVFFNWRAKAIHAITKPENTDIVKGSEGARAKMEAKLVKLQEQHAQALALNKIMRSKKLTQDEKIDKIHAKTKNMERAKVQEFVERGWGFSTSGSTKIRELKKDIEREKKREALKEQGNKHHTINGYNVCENYEINRIQILFDGKPEPEVITKLKSHGFRWSPKNSAWQRQLTNNAIWVTKQFLKEEK